MIGKHLNWRWLAAAAMALCAIAAATPLQPPAIDALTLESRRVAVQVSQTLNHQLLREMQVSGALRSLMVCKYSCPEILSATSRKTGWRVAAVSLKPRNSAVGMPDAWEQKVLADFSQRTARGANPADLEFAQIVTEPQSSYFRYARAIIVERSCLTCHSAREQLAPAIRQQLLIDYPYDRAVDFKVGDLYGILSIKRDLAQPAPAAPIPNERRTP